MVNARVPVFKHRDEHTAVLRGILRVADQARVAQLVLHQLGDRLPPRIRPLVEYCVTHPEDAHSVEEVASTLGLNRKTLVNRCRAEGFPAPRNIIAWCLLLLAAGLLATPNVTVEQIALQLNFPSATALRNMLKRRTGLRPSDLRARDALGEMCARFLAPIRLTP
jgi:AraC-like DNA-binding protein